MFFFYSFTLKLWNSVPWSVTLTVFSRLKVEVIAFFAVPRKNRVVENEQKNKEKLKTRAYVEQGLHAEQETKGVLGFLEIYFGPDFRSSREQLRA